VTLVVATALGALLVSLAALHASRLRAAGATLAILVALVAAAIGPAAPAAPEATADALWQPFDRSRISELVSEGNVVFVDVTAQWCLTCQVNKRFVLDRADVRLVVDDGRRVLAAEPARYDVIVGDLFVPWHAGAGNLYAREMLETVARRLAPDGLFCQWLPLYQLTREEFDVIARTFLTVFPDVSVWRNDFYPDRPVVGLVGRRATRSLDLASVDRRLDALPDWSRDPLLETSRGLLMLALGDLSLARDLVPPGPLDSDDEPTIEFLAPRMTRMNAAGDKDWFTGDPLVAFAEALAARTPVEDDAASAARRAGLALARYALAARRGDDDAAARAEAEVRRLVPDVVAARDDGPPALDGARRALDGLRAQAARVRGDVVALERRLRAPDRPDGTR